MARYKHKPLSTPSSIRIILLAPSLERSSPLRRSRVDTSLDGSWQGRGYDTLSYFWALPGARSGSSMMARSCP
jgi:hypothetical protein